MIPLRNAVFFLTCALLFAGCSSTPSEVTQTQPALTPAEDAAVKAKLLSLGFDIARIQAHPHGGR